ncbi:Glucose dehydrogenase [FAD, quinone] [Folsomia candida]|uniref:Glucose dehydrogenase [FAD, quinone] n=1 Tax=Folsomia candida TaxID=158441 RepID=A0A226E2H8_FOLCA|nr:Glucose dehydrogenase [FAD, quinone] [Folsomia candida]
MVFASGIIRSVTQLRTVLQSVLFVPFAYIFFFNMIPSFLVAWDSATRLQDRFNDNFRGRANTYDFIVVGGGTAGSVVANRLSELYSVLLIESGGPANPLTLIPALTLNLMNRPQSDWRYKTVPQSRACLNSINQECLISAGMAMGGSSTLNHLAFLRGHPSDFDAWARITGDRSWSYDQVLPFFRRSEEFIGTSTDASARGRDGELRIREPDYLGLGLEWLRAGVEMGYPSVDLNGQHGQGFSILQYPLRRGMRQTTDAAFILPIRLSPRLRVLSHTLATRILFRDMTNMAYGVEYERFGRTELAIARREVIISAGGVGSPKLLMLSGVGPRTHLEQMGIPLRSDVPVGRNLQDHLGVPLGPFFFTPLTSPASARSFLLDRDFTPTNIVSWIVSGRGPLSTSGLQGAGAISSMPARARGEANWPDVLLLLHGQGIHSTYANTFATAHSLQVWYISYGRDSFHIRIVGARPTSTGSVLLASTNPRDPPIINPRYLDDAGSADIRILTEGITAALNLVENSTTFRTLGATLGGTLLPGCETQTPRSMAYWTCYIQRFSMSQHDPVGTAAMGAVVDSDLKVRGTRGLRVIDASIMPTIVSVPTLATTIMIAEKGADFILREHGANSTQLPSIGGIVTSAVFGRNGLLVRNPIQRFLASEFDRMNPLPSLFRMPFNRTDFNPFSRFLGFFLPAGQQQPGTNPGLFSSIFAILNPSTLLANLLTPPTPPPPRVRPRPLLNILQQLGGNVGGAGGGNRPFATNSTTNNNLFDIIFPVRNNTITLPNPFQDIYRNQQLNSRDNNFNIFGSLFAPRATTPRPPVVNNASPNPLSFLLGVGQNFQRNPGLVQSILNSAGPRGQVTPSPGRVVTSFIPQLASGSSPLPVTAVGPSPILSTPPTRFWITLPRTSTTTTQIPVTTTLAPATTPGLVEIPLLSGVNESIPSFTVPIFRVNVDTTVTPVIPVATPTTAPAPSTSTTPLAPTSEEVGTIPTESSAAIEDTEVVTSIPPITVDIVDPPENVNVTSDANPSPVVGETGSDNDIDNLRTIRFISHEADKIRQMNQNFHHGNEVHYNDNDFAPAAEDPTPHDLHHEPVPLDYDYDEIVKDANYKVGGRNINNNNFENSGNPYESVDVDYGDDFSSNLYK